MTLLKKLVCSIFILLIPVLLVHASGADAKEQPKDNYQDLQLTNTQVEEAQRSLNFSKLSALAKLAESNKRDFLSPQSIGFIKRQELINCMRLFDDDCFYQEISEFTATELVEPIGSIHSPLHIAVSRGQEKYLKAILQKGADPNISSFTNVDKVSGDFILTPLIHTAVRSYIHLNWELDLELINTRKKTKDSKDFSDNPFRLKKPLKLQEVIRKSSSGEVNLSAENYFSVLGLLIEYGADINLLSLSVKTYGSAGVTKSKRSVLFKAVSKNGISNLVKYLIENGADVNFISQSNDSKIYLTQLAIEANDAKTFNLLVKSGSEIKFHKRFNRFKPAINRWFYHNQYDPSEYGVLSNAIYYNDIDFVETLVKDPTVNLEFSQTSFGRKDYPLKEALFRNKDLFEKLLKAGANLCSLSKEHKNSKEIYSFVSNIEVIPDKEKVLNLIKNHKQNSSCYKGHDLHSELMK